LLLAAPTALLQSFPPLTSQGLLLLVLLVLSMALLRAALLRCPCHVAHC
jgi:hypothetical protein